MPKLADIAPTSREIQLKNGVVAKVGLFTLEHIIQAEEKYGSFEEMMESSGKTTRDLIAILYSLIENKDEVGTVDDFMRETPVREMNIPKMIEMLLWAVGKSMPEVTAAAAKAGGNGGSRGKSTGGTASQPSRGTTRTSSTKS